MYYLDNAATTKPDPRVVSVMTKCLTDIYGNPAGIYSFGQEANYVVESAREQVGRLLHKTTGEIIFTSGGSEANNLAIMGVADHLKRLGKNHIVTSSIEHDSVYNAVKTLGAAGFEVTFVKPRADGIITAQSIKSHIKDNTGLVSVMYVNNETGIKNEVEKIGALCVEKKIYFHTDCVQAAGTYDIFVDKIACDMCSVSAHKIFGPKGAGALYVRDPSILLPRIVGGDDQEYGIRGGTLNVPAIAGFGMASKLALKNVHQNTLDTLLKPYLFYTMLSEHVDGIVMNGCNSKILNIRIDGVDAQTLVLAADAAGVIISAGSACHSHADIPSRVLTEMTNTPEQARSSVRISFSGKESHEDIKKAVNILKECIIELRSV